MYWPPATKDRVIVAYTAFSAPQRGGFVAWDVVSGRELWRHELSADGFVGGSRWAGGPVITDRDIAVTAVSGELMGLNPDNGLENWRIRDRALSPKFKSIRDFRARAVSGGIAVAGSVGGSVVAYDLTAMQPRWSYEAGNGGSVGFRIAARNGLVFVPYLSGHLVVLRLSDGGEVWRLGESGSSGYMWPPVTHGSVLFLVGARGLSSYGWRPHDERGY